MSKHTPGPWRWEIHPKQHTVQLSGGRPQYDLAVMRCERWGMRGAAPSFMSPGPMALVTRSDAFMVPIRGREHHSDWIQTLNHPDAHLIAAAPEQYEAALLQEKADWHYEECHICGDEKHGAGCNLYFNLKRNAQILRRAAIAKAEGR